MMQQRENGILVDVWEMNELVEVVEEFMNQQNSQYIE
jgi:hypothetical protein